MEKITIPNFQNYKISLDGSVWNRHGKKMKPQMWGGYYKVQLRKDEKSCTKQLHQLIAISFLKRVEGKNEINHLNGIKTDNRLENLEWCTRGENTRHAFRTGLTRHPSRRKIKSHCYRGHELNFKNTYLYEKQGVYRKTITRTCRKCKVISHLKWRKKARELRYLHNKQGKK